MREITNYTQLNCYTRRTLEATSSVAGAHIFGKSLIYITLSLERNIYKHQDLICAYPLEDLRPTSCADRAHTPKLKQVHVCIPDCLVVLMILSSLSDESIDTASIRSASRSIISIVLDMNFL